MDKPRLVTRDWMTPIELRAADASAEPNRLVGYAAKFGIPSEPLTDWFGDGFTEVIRAGAFSRTLRDNQDIRALYNHNTDIVLGRTKSDTLRLHEDEVGLAFEVDLPDTQAARDIKAMVSRGDIDGCSFGFYVVADEVAHNKEDGTVVRTLVDVELVEISPAVAFPAYSATEVALRSLRGQRSPARPRFELAKRRLRLLKLN